MDPNSVRTTLRSAAWIALVVAPLLSPSPSAAQSDIRYGEPVAVGDGNARLYVAYDADGRPIEIGVALSAEALTGLPAPAEGSPEASMAQWDLALPDQAPAPYRFAMLNWIPLGHDPSGIYDVPHFDFHFYLVPHEERDAILPADPDYAVKSARAPEAILLPAGNITPPDGTVPLMGTHWIDPASHEFHGQPFTHTFIYGSWDGRLVFVEPMVALALLEGEPDVSIDIVSPEKVAIAGSYPTKYVVRRDLDSGEIRVGLAGLIARN